MTRQSSLPALRRLRAVTAVLAATLTAAILLGTVYWAMESLLGVHPSQSVRVWTQFVVLLVVGLKAFSVGERWCRQ